VTVVCENAPKLAINMNNADMNTDLLRCNMFKMLADELRHEKRRFFSIRLLISVRFD